MKKVVIVSACRTAIGAFGGTLKDVPAAELGALVVKEAVSRAGIKPEQVDEVIFGNVLQAGLGQNVARQVTLKAGLPIETTAVTINIVCGSGLKSVAMAANQILAGESEIVVCGGTENMSAAPYAIPTARWGARMNNNKIVDVMVNDGLWDAFNQYHMGITAENVAEKYGITREMQDEFAVASQSKAEAAVKGGKFKDEIVPVVIHGKKGDTVFDTDEYPKFGTTLEKVAKLKPAFKKDGGTVTAANASGINDSAAAFVVMSQEKAEELQSLLTAYKERFNKDNFIKNLLLDNLLLVDIHNRAKKLHIEVDQRRVVFILETNQDKDYGSLENVKNVLGGKNGDFVTAVDEKSIIIVKELSESDSYPQVDKIANTILTTLGVEKDSNTHIAYGTIVKELKEVSRSYKEARMALDVGKIFFGEKEVIAYSSLGIGRLIYQLPIPLCKMFIREIFDSKSPDDFDEETLTTINKFFENSLNVSETSRQLYIHRNTLVYRLDKLQKSTGLDLRVFEDAITFKIALMVVKYMKYMETLDY